MMPIVTRRISTNVNALTPIRTMSSLPPPTPNNTTANGGVSRPQHGKAHYHRQASHKPRTASPPPTTAAEAEETPLYVLTLLTSPAHHAALSALRKRYFPPRLLKVDAHVTLFHALPGTQLARIKADIRAVLAGRLGEFEICADEAFRMRRGVGVNVSGLAGPGRADGMREELRRRWADVLSQQDGTRGWRGHYTVMNKVDEEEVVEACLEEVRRELGDGGIKGCVKGLQLWRYDRGWWRAEEDFRFEEDGSGGGGGIKDGQDSSKDS